MESQGQHAHSAPVQPPAVGGPQQYQQQPAIDWDQPPEGSGGSNKTLMIVAGAALVIASVGMLRSMMSPKEAVAETPVAAQPNIFTQQAQMMRDAMSMAKEAQAMQRERMEMVRQEMQACEEGYSGGETGPGTGLYEELNGGYGAR